MAISADRDGTPLRRLAIAQPPHGADEALGQKLTSFREEAFELVDALHEAGGVRGSPAGDEMQNIANHLGKVQALVSRFPR